MWMRLCMRVKSYYHMNDLMELRKQSKRHSLYAPAYHLYLDCLLNSQFKERQMVGFILDMSKNKINDQAFQKIVAHTSQNIDKINRFDTIANILTRMYLERFNKPQLLRKFAERGFQLIAQNRRAYSYYFLKFLIAIEKLIGLKQFSDEHFAAIDVAELKPLFLSFVLELFWKNDLQHYQFVEKAMRQLQQFREIIPYNDVHHMIYAQRIVRDPRYSEIVKEVEDRMQSKVTTQGKHFDSDIIETLKSDYMEYLNDKYL